MSRGPLPRHLVDFDDDAPETLSADRGVYISRDGRSRRDELSNISHKKRRVAPTDLTDSFGEWVPVPDEGFSEEGARQVASDEAASILGKRKGREYISTRDPASLWRPLKGFFLDELLFHEGLGDALDHPECVHCQKQFNAADPSDSRIFKCYECGEVLQCEACCIAHHERHPLHVIKEWNGTFWVACTLRGLGLVYQLGHGGLACPFPDDVIHEMTIIEAPIIHQIHMRYCKCEKSDEADNLQQLMRNTWYPATVTDPRTCATFRSLESYRLYNVVGNMNVRDFITALERVTDTTAASGMTWLPDRYKQFQRMARQWAFLKRLLRAGRAHDPAGVEKTALGECAVNCWACPHDGRNLPPDWRNVDPKYQFLYMLLLALDANFRLKNRMRTNEVHDPSLGPGWGYWVEPEKYRNHVKKYVNEKDISTCIAFAALLQKDTRLTTGLRVSGVGGCVCARHECMRPNGLGDLQKGERYANMDFIAMAALAGFGLMLLTISYDIACQWKINLRERMKNLPADMRLPLDDIKLQCALPVWHAASHNVECQNENSLSFATGVGKSDGEGVERTWSVLNPAAFSTKDAGRGQRADTLEGKIDNHNYLKNVGQGVALQRKLVVALAERARQVASFKEVNRTVPTATKKEWTKAIDDWVNDRSSPNPFTLPRGDCPTEAEVRLEIRKDEDALTAGGKAPLYGRSATAFLVAGIQIEDTQRRVLAELAGTVLVAADRENKIEEWRHTLLVKIARFRSLQKIYMPGVTEIIEAAECARDSEMAPPKPEKVELYMPSAMVPRDGTDRLRGCVRGLVEMEAKLRVAVCENSLESLRSRLHVKRHLISYRDENVIGQVHTTKARSLIEQVGERVEAYAKRYRQSRAALISLDGEGAHTHLRELKPDDVRLDRELTDSDTAARDALGRIGAGQGARPVRHAPGASRATMSWIWTAPGALDDPKGRLHDSIRVEWARAFARKTRWCEEVMLLREEMRRVLRYLGWQTTWWREQVSRRSEWDGAAVAAGARAYALKQAAWHERLAGHFQTKWNASALIAAGSFVAAESVDNLDEFF